MTEEQSSYRQIFKATSLFGGVQVFNILIAIIRSKFIAVLLGPTGMGIAGLLTTTTQFIGSLTNFGLGTSAVKNVAAASASGDEINVSKTVTILRRLVWITGLIGMLFTLVFSPWLSFITFGNKNYTFAFVWISMTLLFQQLSSGQSVILQGLRKLNYLARANMIGALSGLIISIPIYYYFRLDGIVPVIILTSLTSLVLTWYFSKRIRIRSIKIEFKATMEEGREMLKMGLLLSLAGLIASGASYFVRIFISNTGGLDQVGLYNAGFAIITTYVGMVFTAMATDYYPRLSAVAQNDPKAGQLINQQAEIAILILSPILSVFLIFINWVVIIFYSTRFISVNEMIHWAALGMYFKAASWSIAFIFIARGESKLFFWNELLGNIYILGFNIAGYRLGGLEGLGISFLIAYIVYLLQVFFLANKRYGFSFGKEFYKSAGLQFCLGLMCFIIVKLLQPPWTYLGGVPLIAGSAWFSFRELDKRIKIKQLINEQFARIRN